MSREELLQKARDEIISIAKQFGITQYCGKGRKTKEQLIDEILSKAESKETEQEVQPVDDDTDWQVPTESAAEAVEEKTENVLTDAEREIKKKAYIENVKIGTLVAFKSITGKVKSAKVVKRSTKNRKLKVETKYGAEFVIPYDDVIWVRTNKRWPKGVYQLLKGVTENEEVKG